MSNPTSPTPPEWASAPAAPVDAGTWPPPPQAGATPSAPPPPPAPAAEAAGTDSPPQNEVPGPVEAPDSSGTPGGLLTSTAEPQVMEADASTKDGLAKCARCGSTEIALNVESGMLRCSFCRFEWLPMSASDAFDINGDIGLLHGLVIGSGSKDIVASTDDVLTFKCSACGAEVVVDTASSTQARCHWCRNKLSINQQIPNGAVPDVVLPFKLKKEAAVEKIAEFVKKRQFYAHPKFRQEFNAENTIGVYLPYMIVDVNGHATFSGQGEHETRRYTVKHGDSEETRYDADVYDVTRSFAIHINDLTIESSTELLQRGHHNTNNIINSVMPFDVENSVTYDSNFLAGFASERRDTNTGDLTPIITVQSQDIARHSANDTLDFYDRGVRWDNEQFTIEGQRWVAAYLPVWLYSYFEDKGNGKGLLHYVAVNGRTGETMGSVPINQRRLLAVAALVQIVGMIVGIIILIAAG